MLTSTLRRYAAVSAAGAIVASGALISAVNMGGPDYAAQCRDAAYSAAYARLADPSYPSPGPSTACLKLRPATRQSIAAEVLAAVTTIAT
jgi:hypothetical protein